MKRSENRKKTREEQRKQQEQEVGPNIVEGLGDRRIIPPYYLDKEIFIQEKIAGVGNLFLQDWEQVYLAARKEVYTHLVTEFYDRAHVLSQ